MTLAIRDLQADVHESFAHPRAAVIEAEKTSSVALLAEALALRGEFEAACCDGEAFATLDRASMLADGIAYRPLVFSPRFSLATVHMWRDELEPAAEGFAAELVAAVEWGDSYEHVHALMHLAQVEWRRGDWALAAKHGDEAWELWQDSGDAPGVGGLLWVRAVIAAHCGELEIARRLVGEAVAADVPDRIYRARHEWLLGFVELSEGRPERALPYLDAAAKSFRESGWREPGLRLFATDLIEANVLTGQLDEAEAEADELLRLGGELGRPRALAIGLRGRGAVQAARGDLEAALGDLETSLEAGRGFPVPFERARTLLVLGSVQRRARRRREARATLGRALELFEGLGAPAFAERARAELGRIGGRTGARDELTPAEHRIAGLVAGGRTNKEVARELVVSIHTVEAALTRVYRKLGLRSRAELAGRFRELEPSKQ
jgi:DNA-binding CsgD family transcriptional regulator